MQVTAVLIRHALPESTSSVNDFLVPLSEAGKNIQQSMCNRMKIAGIQPTKIFYSPSLRTTQTASIIGDYFHAPIIREDALSVETPNELTILNMLKGAKNNSTLFFVGHAPTLHSLASYLCNTLPFRIHQMRSSALILTFEDTIAPGKARYTYYLTPDTI